MYIGEILDREATHELQPARQPGSEGAAVAERAGAGYAAADTPAPAYRRDVHYCTGNKFAFKVERLTK